MEERRVKSVPDMLSDDIGAGRAGEREIRYAAYSENTGTKTVPKKGEGEDAQKPCANAMYTRVHRRRNNMLHRSACA